MASTLPHARAFVVEAELELDDGFDPRAVGGAVTVELCGHAEHEGPCRWPHHSAIDAQRTPVGFCTVAVSDDDEADDIAARIHRVLEHGAGWRLIRARTRAVGETEAQLASNLLAGPRRPASG